MAWPSWMPSAARPSIFPDWSEIFRTVIPREWPENLFGPGTQGMGDLKATGESLALARDMLEFALRYIWPGKDTGSGYFLSDWEKVFGISPAATLASRSYRIIASMRQRGTMTEGLVKAIMAPAFGTTDPAEVAFDSPSSADVAAEYSATATTENHVAFLGTNLHIYSGATPQVEPDWGLAADLIARIKPTGDTWSFGKSNYLIWGVHADDGEWDRRTWGK